MRNKRDTVSPACVFLETDSKRRFPDLLLEQIFLVQKENNRRVGKPLVVADGVEQLQAFLHPILQSEPTFEHLNNINLLLTPMMLCFQFS